MKTLFILLLSLIAFSSFAQKNIHVRVIRLHEDKKSHGILNTVSDSAITVNDTIINYNDIAVIKINKSTRHIVKTLSIAFLGSAITAIAANNVYNDFVSGLLHGFSFGFLFGSFFNVTESSHIYHIDGNLENWLKVKPLLVKK